MSQGKRGPNGGVIDIDDPREVMGRERIVLRSEIRLALSRVEWAASERMAGRKGNADRLLGMATDGLANVILVMAGK